MENTKETESQLQSFDKYYQDEFRKIIESDEQYKGRWNWYAFLLSWVWCFAKGCWLSGIAMIVFLAILFAPTWGLIVLVIPIYMGYRGTWILYNAKMKKKQVL